MADSCDQCGELIEIDPVLFRKSCGCTGNVIDFPKIETTEPIVVMGPLARPENN